MTVIWDVSDRPMTRPNPTSTPSRAPCFLNSWPRKPAAHQLQIASPRLRVCVEVVLVELVAVALLVVLVVAWLPGRKVQAKGLPKGP